MSPTALGIGISASQDRECTIGRFKFSRRLRLRGDALDRVFSLGKKFVMCELICWHVMKEDDPHGRPRLGLSVSRKLGKAVFRNRMKRLLRESFRLNAHRIKPGTDLAVYPRPGIRWRKLQDAEKSLMDLCHKAGVLLDA